MLPQIIQEGTFRTQSQVAAAVASHTGQQLNQATISRELNNLGVRKMSGVYRLPSSRRAGANIYSVDVTGAGCLFVVKTDNAFASVVANRIDNARLAGVLGTIAGDDTVFVATTGSDALPPLCELLGHDPDNRRRRA